MRRTLKTEQLQTGVSEVLPVQHTVANRRMLVWLPMEVCAVIQYEWAHGMSVSVIHEFILTCTLSSDLFSVWFGNSHQNDHQARRRFVEWAQNEITVVPDFHKRILFTDEAHFWLNGYVNKQNCRIWSEANPQVYVETPLHPEKLTV
ncbi:uncharacterized protein TNCV_2011441 [Trichonephila clavipes]|nr:uncharacterized protein TNCV_2011441 [Trichonephila clavipes]